jgi:hypothetical protein
LNPVGTNRRRNLDKHVDALAAIQHDAGKLHSILTELFRRDDQPTGPDGYPTSTGGSAQSTISTHSTGSTTETAALQLAERGRERDVIRHARMETVGGIWEAHGALRQALSTALNALELGDSNRGRQSTLSPCGNPHCDQTVTGQGEDRMRDGRCPRCYTWRRRHPGQEWNRRLDPTTGVA